VATDLAVVHNDRVSIRVWEWTRMRLAKTECLRVAPRNDHTPGDK
jgi:hypothetical protein